MDFELFWLKENSVAILLKDNFVAILLKVQVRPIPHEANVGPLEYHMRPMRACARVCVSTCICFAPHVVPCARVCVHVFLWLKLFSCTTCGACVRVCACVHVFLHHMWCLCACVCMCAYYYYNTIAPHVVPVRMWCLHDLAPAAFMQ